MSAAWQSIRTRLMVGFVAVIAGVTALTVPFGREGLRDAVEAVEERALHSHYTALLAAADMTTQSAIRLATLVADTAEAQRLFAAHDRDGLRALYELAYTHLADEYGVRQFQFHTPPATSFLRLHRPQYGDDLSSFRHTVVEANRRGEPVIGLEKGVAGFGVRAVAPVRYQDQQIGTVEFGLDFGETFAKEFARRFDVAVVIHVPASDGAFTVMGRSDDRSLAGPEDLRVALDGGLRVLRSEGTAPVAVIVGPVRDYSDTPVAVVEILMDRSAYAAILTESQSGILLFAAALIAIGSVVSWGLAGSLARPITAMTAAMERLAAGDVGTGTADVGRDDEIGAMARAFQVFRHQAIENRTLGRTRQEMAVIVAGSHDAIYGIDADHRITSWNGGAEAIFGYRPEEVLGKPFTMLVPEADREHGIERMEAVLRGETVEQIEVVRLRADGSPVTLSLAASLIDDGSGHRGVAIIARDVTEQRRALKLLEASRARLREAERIGRLGHWEWNIDTGRLIWSEQVFALFGLPPAPDGAYAYEDFLNAIHREDRPLVEQAVARALEGERYDIQHRIVLPDGAVRHLHERGEVYRDADGRPERMLGTVMDVTRHLAQAAALSRVNQALRTLSAGNEVLVHASDEARLLHDMARTIVGVGGYRAAWVAYRRDGVLERQAAAGDPACAADAALAWTSPSVKHPAAVAVRSGEAQIARAHGDSDGAGPPTLAFPLRDRDGVFGAFVIEARDGHSFNDDEWRLLGELSGDLAYGIANLRARVEQTQNLWRLENSMEQTIQAVAATLETRDPYTAGHQQRVAKLAAAIAERMELPADEVKGIYMAGIIHDIGKIYVPSEILNRPGKLRPEEFALIRTHCEVGAGIIEGVRFPWPVRDILLQHHERLDGSGYPYGLQGEAVSMGARILAVADVVEAISSHRPYRPALGLEPALEEIRGGAGRRYDAAVVAACLKVVEATPALASA